MKKHFFFLALYLSVFSLKSQTIGILQNTESSFNGYTLFAPNNNNVTYLIDNCGNQINSWEAENPPGISAYLLEDGTLLRTARIPNSFLAGGSGGRIQMFNWEGNLTWSYDYSTFDYHQHHDVEYLENGNILVLAWERHTEEEAASLGRISNGDIWAERIVELEPIGSDSANIVWEWHVWDHMIQDSDSSLDNYGIINQHPELWNINFNSNSNAGEAVDWLHFNAIDYNPDLDQIILSSKHLSEFYIIDHSTTSEEAAGHTGGNSQKGGDILYRWGNPLAYNRGTPVNKRLFGPHDVHWIPNGLLDAGKIMIFNNGANRPEGSFSTVDIIDPAIDENGNYPVPEAGAFLPTENFWSYGENVDDFFSSRLSGAQRQDNGNTLICDGGRGRIFEVNTGLQVVWEYINPVAQTGPFNQGDNPSNNTLFRAYRYSPFYPAFDDVFLEPGLPIEGNPINQDCIVFEDLASSLEDIPSKEVFALQNPIINQLVIQNTFKVELEITITDVSGRIFAQRFSNQEQISFDANYWTKGIYFVHFYEKESGHFSIIKVIKI